MTVLHALADVGPLAFREAFRDWVIIAVGLAWALMFLMITAVALVIGFGAKGVLGAMRRLIDDDVKPILDNVKGTTETVRGTTEFMSEKAVSPVIRIYGMVAALRRVLGALFGLRRRSG